MTSIDVLKIDVEGHELPVLEGAAALFAAASVKTLYVEVGLTSNDRTHTFIGDILKTMEANDFWFHGIYDLIPVWDHLQFGTPRYANILMVHGSIRKMAHW